MANRYYNSQFMYSFNAMPTYIQGNFTVGSTGAVGTIQGSGISTITKLATGIYSVTFTDSYARFLGASITPTTTVTGGAITAGSFVTGTAYQIVTLGTTDYSLVGLPTGLTQAVGQTFVATGAGTGTGTVKALASSGIFTAEIAGNPNLMCAAQPGYGGTLIFEFKDATNTLVEPASGSLIFFEFMFRNSSVKGKGE